MSILQLERVLAHVPGVALLVLGVPVEGSLDRVPALRHGVAQHRAGHSGDGLRAVEDHLVVDLRGAAPDAAVVVSGLTHVPDLLASVLGH